MPKLTISTTAINSMFSDDVWGCSCNSCRARRAKKKREMWVQRYYAEGTRPAADAPRGLDRALFGVRDFRCHDGHLYSTYIEHAWVAGKEERAICVPLKDHQAPHPTCRCGLYSFYNREGVLKHGDGYVGEGQGVRGVVSAWGDVVLHERGFRSEYMRLEALLYEPVTIRVFDEQLDLMPVYEKIAQSLGIPLIIPEEIGGFARERGLLVLRDQTYQQTPDTWQRAGALPGKGVEPEASEASTVGQSPEETRKWAEDLWLHPLNYTDPQCPIPPPTVPRTYMFPYVPSGAAGTYKINFWGDRRWHV